MMSPLLPWCTVERVGTCQKVGGGAGFAETTRTQEECVCVRVVGVGWGRLSQGDISGRPFLM